MKRMGLGNCRGNYMNRSIWKFPLDLHDCAVDGTLTITVPASADILSVADQPGIGICLWAMVDANAEKKPHRILIMGTGRTMPLEYVELVRFVGTVVTFGGKLVWHVFDIIGDVQ